MNIVLTGSLGNISKPLATELVRKGHRVTVISSKAERQKDIDALGAKAAIGSIKDLDFLVNTFHGADIVYLMEPSAQDRMFDKTYDPYKAVAEIVNTYKSAVERSGIKKVVHLSSIGAHTDTGVGLLKFHFMAETILKTLPADVSIKFMRPVGFYYNLLANIEVIKSLSKGFVGAIMALQHYGLSGLLRGKRGLIMANYGGDIVNLLVSPIDIAAVIAEEMDKPFEGYTVRYIASEERTCNEVAGILGAAIGKPYLKWGSISDKMLTNTMLKRGMNEMLVHGLVEMGASGRSGRVYEDYYKHRPVLGKTKLSEYAPIFAKAYASYKDHQ
ncbi:SDR family oxidoreductase [Dinghuibacter silviterrae]|uniref:Uncharacterized protein YbjT (DUF2867 family) n=1 Tax=Dinghuibacter silviterrae TaxID=1539049 RepID=A0A4R8DM84_9BACT|nr:NAD(P)H-binding protein [Dinghuibacter silviterrae]TDW99053.1 uncharacterized protein YbjT (DUF2867 family) [Dinghuibacter silviterrae]